ncbi:DUF4097 family beta strand repeat-containing protein [Actinoplanes couchii]|uniref:DUF4097 domain-containing protein n=1 Tax=Actinoplanes couchii TaxID=403638 RepID=A0ABQ3X8M3_9ACTN|nr:DUF4097 family beta strand repeat-containing protein [Actinoplanes couchii]MDR6320144.1 DUF4097 and DUF4098 domain-containing protein YvlB [Actinoplanes couchii]GID54842.1 hypothetical protein Aco03nite_032460 [Actinoplanes couchii]
MMKFDTPTPVSAVLGIPAGRIRLIAADRADTTVEIRPENAAKSRDVEAAQRIAVDYTDGVLRVVAEEAPNRLLGASGAVEVTIQLPAGSRVEAVAALADFRGVGRLGDVTVESANGSITLDETAAARLTLQAGDVKVGRLGGPARITTSKGDLHVTEAVEGTVTLSTDHGDISIGAARGTAATLDAGTRSGRVHNTLTSTEGGAALSIHATTAHGDITAHSL